MTLSYKDEGSKYFLHCAVSGCDSIIVNTKIFTDARSDANVIWIRHRNTAAFRLSEPAHLAQSLCHLYAFRYSLKTCKHAPETKTPSLQSESLPDW